MDAWLRRWGVLLATTILLLGLLFLKGSSAMVDEIPHAEQALLFASGAWTVNPDLTVIPGYHALLAGLSSLTGWSSLSALRFFNALFALTSLLVFWLIAKNLPTKHQSLRAAQFFFLPLLFPFFFLVYTETVSLFFILLLALFAVRKQHLLAGLAGLLACLVRQNNVVWVAFFLAWTYVDDHGWRVRPLKTIIRSYWPYLLVGLLFVLYVFLNGGVSFGDAQAHPSFHFSLTNAWFFLFLSFWLFLPSLYEARARLFSLTKHWWFWASLCCALAVFSFTFTNTHPYNTQWGEYFLRNRLLIFFSSSWWASLLLFFPAAIAASYYALTPLRKHYWLLFPFTLFFLAPSWLVEQRYYIIPLALFLAAKKPSSLIMERAQLFWFAAWSIALFLIILSGKWFL